MNETAVKAQIIMNTLGQLNVPATAENTDRLTVIWQLLTQIRDEPAPAPAVPAVRAVPADSTGSGAADRSGRAPVTQEDPEEDKDGKAET